VTTSFADIAVDAQAVEKAFGSRVALKGVTFSVGRGELFGLVGPDGAGKTTFLRVLAGLLLPTAGRVCIDGIDVGVDPVEAKHRIGYMSQRFSLSQTLTVAENLEYIAEVWHVPPSDRRKRVARLLEFSRLAPFQTRLTGNLSGGMKQKLSLCACLIHQPRILLLDEPTIGVDPISRRDFWLILYDLLQEGSTILLSTPYMDEAERCSRVAFLLDGRLIACGSPDELKGDLGTVILDIRCSDGRAVQKRLRQEPDLADAALFGDHVHIPFPRVIFDLQSALERVRRIGIEVDHWQVREPSLEDVFLAFARTPSPVATSGNGGGSGRGSATDSATSAHD